MGTTTSKFAYQVLKVKEHSPAEKAGLISYFDYIAGISDTLLDEHSHKALETAVKASINQKLKVLVYNSRINGYRDVEITPHLGWDNDAGLLGCNVRFLEYSNAHQRVWKILEVVPGGCAEAAGLQPEEYFVASLDKVLFEEEDFRFLIEKNPNSELRFIIYNASKDRCREVFLKPGKDAFNKGTIGCTVGYSAIYRVPFDHSLMHRIKTNSMQQALSQSANPLESLETMRKSLEQQRVELEQRQASLESQIQRQLSLSDSTSSTAGVATPAPFDAGTNIAAPIDIPQQAAEIQPAHSPETVSKSPERPATPSDRPLSSSSPHLLENETPIKFQVSPSCLESNTQESPTLGEAQPDDDLKNVSLSPIAEPTAPLDGIAYVKDTDLPIRFQSAQESAAPLPKEIAELFSKNDGSSNLFL